MERDEQSVIEVLRHIATNVSIVTTRDGETLHGMTATMWAEAVHPPRVLITLNRESQTYRYIQRSRIFAVSLLADTQEELAVQFGKGYVPHSDLFSRIGHHAEATGAPVLDGCVAFFDCRVEGFYPFGSYDIVTGQVEAAGLDSAEGPLVYYASRLGRLVPFGEPVPYPPAP